MIIIYAELPIYDSYEFKITILLII